MVVEDGLATGQRGPIFVRFVRITNSRLRREPQRRGQAGIKETGWDCLGFSGSAAIETEAGLQLLRLERFGSLLAGCHLAIERRSAPGLPPVYEIRLDLIWASQQVQPVERQESADPCFAIRAAFDLAQAAPRRAADAQAAPLRKRQAAARLQATGAASTFVASLAPARDQIFLLSTTGLPPIVCFVIHAASAESM